MEMATGLPIRRFLFGLVLVLSILTSLPVTSAQQAESPRAVNDGLFLSVRDPIDEQQFRRIKAQVELAIRRGRKIATIVFDFTPDDMPAQTADLPNCQRLAEYIKSINPKITTVAFVHGQVQQHSVLPVLACSQLIMSAEARIGPIAKAGEFLKRKVREEYEALANTRGLQVAVEKLLAGQSLSSAEARRLGWCQEIYATREEVRQALHLPRRSLREDELAGRTPIPCLIALDGVANGANLESFKRRVKAMVSEGHNLFFLRLNSEGGDAARAVVLQQFLKELRDRNGEPAKVVAFVPPGCNLGAATFLALGADEIVMGSNSYLGDFSYLRNPNPQLAETIDRLARQMHYPPALFRATLDPKIVVYRVQPLKNPGSSEYVTEQEWKADQALQKPKWSKQFARIVKNNGETVKISFEVARDAGIAVNDQPIDNFEQLCRLYGIADPNAVTISRSDWLDAVARFFRHPVVKILLLLIGMTGLILEIKMPGFGVPGITAALCFVLFFWSHSMVGEYTWLAILLFLLGLLLLGLEIFVIPGFGVTGFAGISLLVFSLVLVMLDKMPTTPQDWQEVAWSVSYFLISFIGAVVAAIAIATFLPQIPYANRMMLQPPDEEEGEDVDPIEKLTQANAVLLGAIGIAETPLRPAGKARIGDEYIDVISEGEYIAPGSRVQVIEIEGNRIVVKEV